MRSLNLIYFIVVTSILNCQQDSTYKIFQKETSFSKVYLVKNKLRVVGVNIENNRDEIPFSTQMGFDLRSSYPKKIILDAKYFYNRVSDNSIDNFFLIAAYDQYHVNRFFYKIDSNNNVAFKYKIQSDSIYYVTKIIQTSDLGYLITGYAIQSMKEVASVFKLSSIGHMEWYRSYSQRPINNLLGYGLFEKNDFYYLLLSKEQSYVPSPPYFKNNSLIYKLSKSGDSLDSWIDTSNNTSIGFSELIVDSFENFIFTGNKLDSLVFDTPNLKSYFIKHLFIACKDKLNKILWEKNLQVKSNVWTYLKKVKLLNDGNIIAVGINYNIKGNDSSICGYAIKLNRTGQIIWEKNYRTSLLSSLNNDYFDDIVELDDGSCIIVGRTEKSLLKDSIYSPLYERIFGWAIRINKNGDIYNSISHVGDNQSEDNLIFPNPVSDEICCSLELDKNEFVSLILVDLNGRTVETYFNHELKLKGKHLCKFRISDSIGMGYYYLNLKIGEKREFMKIFINR